MFMKTRKILMVISFVMILVVPMLIAAAPAQDVEPPATEEPKDALELLASFLDPVIELAGKVAVIVFGLAIFLLGTVQGTNFLKLFLPKKGWAWYEEARPKLIRAISFFVAVFAMVGSKVDFFGILSEVEAVYTVDPIFGQLLGGATLSYASNWYYDNKIKEKSTV